MDELEVKKFYNKNKSYCAMPFKEIYGDNAGRYRFCCHATEYEPIKKYTTTNTTPFDFFFSSEMEEVRNKMLSGEKIDACKVCYDLEKNNNESYRTGKYKKKYGVDLEPKRIGLKLRIHGSYCNLGCYMCHPYNSSTRRNELKKVFGNKSLTNWNAYQPLNHKQWNDSVNDIISNIDKVAYMNITGGEPLQLPGHWKLLDRIPDEHAKHITLSYDTNLTELEWKNKSIFDYVDKFEKINLGVSCDHYGKKEEWIRYPIDIKKFENNLKRAHNLIKQLNCTVSLLNVFDLSEIYDYYMNKFGIKTTFVNVCRGPEFLSVRNLKQKDKDMLLEKYKNFTDFSYFENEIRKHPTHEFDKLRTYCDSLSKHRNFDWKELWNEF
tara:strand:+ start:501 stop:1637 length:1137 start_codon:yes stop_codon:yes gene_type:complete